MKQKIVMIACLCFGFMANAQSGKGLGIGVQAPDPSAILHIQSDNHGVLIPNVTLTDLMQKTPIDADIKESLLVYNKGNQTIAKGYYYWTVTASTSKWVRVLTSDDQDSILEGQIQESFVEEMKEENGVMVGTGVFIYTPDKNNASDENAPGRLVLDIPSLVKKNETITSFTLEQYELYYYANGETSRIPFTESELSEKATYLKKQAKELELVYIDEKGEEVKFAVKDLLGANNEDVPAITNLIVNNSLTGLVYTNDKGIEIPVDLVDIIKKNETLTSIDIDEHDNLIFTNERGRTQQVSIRNVVREPWHKAEDNSEATTISDNIFTTGWTGIGLKPEEAKVAIHNLKPDEKLRVNGSIYARNSYYADYVFDNYFTNEASALKYDYSFKDLTTVESFIKENYHLPGITPIGELEKSADEGYLINVSELSIQLLEKVEELYLHTIEQQKVINSQKDELDVLKQQFLELERLVKANK